MKRFVILILVCGLALIGGAGYSRASEGQTWLVMLYFDADDETLEEAIFEDLNEAELIGSTDRVQIVAQIDRYPEGFDGDGDWTSAKRFYLTKDEDFNRITSEELDDLGEVSMGDPETFEDFAVWSIENYPADNYVLIMSDHGMGWPGGWTDEDPEEESILYLNELDEALGAIRDETGIDQFEMVGFDVCLLSHLEVYAAVAPHARYAVASQETEPGIGWAYMAFLSQLVQQPDMSGAELAQSIVSTYLREDIVALSMSEEEVAEYFTSEATLAAIDLSYIPSLQEAFNAIISELQHLPQELVAEARTYTQTFTSVFGERVPPSYLDLGHFMHMLTEFAEDEAVGAAAQDVLTALSDAVIVEFHGPQRPGATGISIYFPNSKLYMSNTLPGASAYAEVAGRFAVESLWEDFLLFHYSGSEIDLETGVAIPEDDMEYSAPGAGDIEIAPIEISADVIGEDGSVILETDIIGERIGFIYHFVEYYDEENDLTITVDMDFIEADDTKEINGVFYPDWNTESEIGMSFEWEPYLTAISDGTNVEYALLRPEDYGESAEEAIYSVEGIYTFAKSGNERDALLFFDNDGNLLEVLAFTGTGLIGGSAPRQVTPTPGDTFTLLDEVGCFDEDDDVTYKYEEGATLTFGTEPFQWEELPAPPGEYFVGFMVEDQDGNINEEWESILVE